MQGDRERKYMLEIILTENNNNVTADSRMIAEHFEKEHKNVIRDIGSILSQSPESTDFFMPSSYPDSYGRKQKNYQLTRDGFSLLVMGFTGSKALEWKLKYIKAFNEMEARLKTARIPQNFAEALRLAADQADILERQKPLVAFAETCAQSQTAVLVRELAKIASKDGFEIGEKRLWRQLREWGLIIPGSTEPYQRFIDNGYFEVTQGVHENSGGAFLHKTSRVLPKGQIYIINRLRKECAS